jgi:hypothetical protein
MRVSSAEDTLEFIPEDTSGGHPRRHLLEETSMVSSGVSSQEYNLEDTLLV